MKPIIAILLLFVLCQTCSGTSYRTKSRQNRRVCVVGAGVAGLATAQQLLAAGQRVTVLEATAHVGGTWHYEPRVGSDEYGRPVHSSMYKYLRTNVPYQLLELPGFPITHVTPNFLNGTTYNRYLQKFTDHYNLRPHIKLLHEVMEVSRVDGSWRVVYKDFSTGTYHVRDFDYVIMCVGHFSKPNLPNIPGEKKFKGAVIHSHDYRAPEPYTNRRVLIIGSGPSAMDLVTTLTRYSSRVVHSHHSDQVRTPFPRNYVHRPDVERYTEDGVIFKDGTYEQVDDVIYCTGYQFDFPFLDHSSELEYGPKTLAPLYNHVVNIKQPTMLWVGHVFSGCAILTIATQARYAAAVVSGRAALPPQSAMLAEWSRGGDSDVNTVTDDRRYFDAIAAAGRLPRVPPVLPALCARDNRAKLDNFYTFRDYVYTVLDDERFARVCPPGRSCWNDKVQD